MKKFSLEELKKVQRARWEIAYFAFEGKVYNVSDSGLWQGQEHMAAQQQWARRQGKRV